MSFKKFQDSVVMHINFGDKLFRNILYITLVHTLYYHLRINIRNL
jgi:hypothetical protein